MRRSSGTHAIPARTFSWTGRPATLLLLDEPSEGLAPLIVRELGQVIRRLRGELGVLLAEQNARFAIALCDRGYVLEKGEVRFEGKREALVADPEIQGRYLAV